MSERELGKQYCREGRKHSPDWPDEVTKGYAEQYAIEQQEDAKCQTIFKTN